MKVFFLGDVYGSVGKRMVKEYLPSLIDQYKVDFVIANVENATNTKGLNYEDYKYFDELGIDALTLGNHFFSSKLNGQFINNTPKLIRPLNLRAGTALEGSKVFIHNGIKIRVSVVLCKTFMKDYGQTNIFKTLEKLDTNMIHIVEIHGEAYSEKLAFAHYYKDYASAILGTHTHNQTVDAKIIDSKLGFIGDVGMCGPRDGIIGASVDSVIRRETSPTYVKLEEDLGKGMLNLVYLEIDEKTFKTTKIERIVFEEK